MGPIAIWFGLFSHCVQLNKVTSKTYPSFVGQKYNDGTKVNKPSASGSKDHKNHLSTENTDLTLNRQPSTDINN